MDEVKYKTIKVTGFYGDIDKIKRLAKAAHTTVSMLILDLCMPLIDKIIEVRYIGKEEVDLIPGKIYSCIEYSKGKGLENYMRVIDESGEAYIYWPEDFEIVEKKVERK